MPDDTDITQYEDDPDALQSHVERLAQVATLSMLVVAAVKRSDKKDQILDLFQRAVADAAKEIRQENKRFSGALADAFESHAQKLLSNFQQTGPWNFL